MARAEDFLKPGEAQRKALMGIGRHGYKHAATDLPGTNRLQYAQAARNDLRSADRAVAYRQSASENVLFGNSRSGMAGWLNTRDPGRSTYFKPHGSGGVEGYFNRVLQRRTQSGDQSRNLIAAKAIEPTKSHTISGSGNIHASPKPLVKGRQPTTQAKAAARPAVNGRRVQALPAPHAIRPPARTVAPVQRQQPRSPRGR